MENSISLILVAISIFFFGHKNDWTGKAIAQAISQTNIKESGIFYQQKEFGIAETVIVEDRVRSLEQKETEFGTTIKDTIAPEINMLRELRLGIFCQNDTHLYSRALKYLIILFIYDIIEE